MICWLQTFRTDESGAVTVDWVVLTAAIIGLTLAIIIMLKDSFIDPATGISATIQQAVSLELDF